MSNDFIKRGNMNLKLEQEVIEEEVKMDMGGIYVVNEINCGGCF